MSRERVYPAGTAIAFAEGEYSDYGFIGHLVTLKTCDIPALIAEFKAAFKPRDEYDEADPGQFVAWLVAHGHAFPADVSVEYLGSYGRLG